MNKLNLNFLLAVAMLCVCVAYVGRLANQCERIPTQDLRK
jgi:hypothetical protein